MGKQSADRRPTIGQEQTQSLNIESARHGMTDEVSCPYAQFWTRSMPSWLQKKEMLRRTVKVLFYCGKVNRVFCHHLSNLTCLSPLRDVKNVRCHILEVGEDLPRSNSAIAGGNQ